MIRWENLLENVVIVEKIPHNCNKFFVMDLVVDLSNGLVSNSRLEHFGNMPGSYYRCRQWFAENNLLENVVNVEKNPHNCKKFFVMDLVVDLPRFKISRMKGNRV